MSETASWYVEDGWRVINTWLTKFAAKGYRSSYLGNIEGIPNWIDKKELVNLFNQDCKSWTLSLDTENDFLCISNTM